MQCVCKKEYCYKRMGTTLKLIAKSSILTSILSEELNVWNIVTFKNFQPFLQQEMNAGKFSIPCFNTAAFDIKRQFSQHCSHITFLRSKVDLCHI